MRKLVIGFLLFAFTLAVVFFWNELDGLSLASKANDEKIGNYFTSIGAIAAAISIYFLFRQLKEAGETRKSIYQPDLYPNPIYFKVSDIDISNNNGKGGVRVLPFFIDDEVKDVPYIQISNIGFGAAKSIRIEWEYDFDEIEEYVKNVYLYSRKKEVEFIDFMEEKQKYRINLPVEYIACCGVKLNPKLTSLFNNDPPIIKPSLRMIVSYLDIGNNKYVNNYDIRTIIYEDVVAFSFNRV